MVKRNSGGSRESTKRFQKKRFCSIPCRLEWQREWYINDNPGKHFDNSGENNPMYGKPSWNFNPKGSRRKDGYIRLTIDGKRVLKHRYLMGQSLNRELTENEIVHHKDSNNGNNDINNLMLITQSEHINLHRLDLSKGDENGGGSNNHL